MPRQIYAIWQKALLSIRPVFLCLQLAGLTGCTTLGATDMIALNQADFGPQETLRLCIYLDNPTVTKQKAESLVGSIQEELSQYNMQVNVVAYENWNRPSGSGAEIIESLASQKLTPPCDRILAMASRNFGDFLIGLFGIDELGSVDTVTNTRGYIAVDILTPNQLLTPPRWVAVHETYHLLGCQHQIAVTECYSKIRGLKKMAALNRERGNSFFPTFSRTGEILLTREDVNAREAMAVIVEKSRRLHGQ